MAFSVYEVIRVACLSRSWFVYAPWETSSWTSADKNQLLYARPIQSNKTEEKTNRTQSNSNRSIGLGNRTKSNTYFAVSSIFEPIEPI